MVHREFGALSIIEFIFLSATTNWLLGEYRNISEGGGKGTIAFDRLFLLIKIILEIGWWR
jgi:hypothetical protein